MKHGIDLLTTKDDSPLTHLGVEETDSPLTQPGVEGMSNSPERLSDKAIYLRNKLAKLQAKQ